MKKIGIAIILVLAVLGSAVYAAPPEPGTAVTNLVVQNKATGADQQALAQVQYYDTSGNLDYTHTGILIDPKAVVEIKTQDEPAASIPDGWEGSAVLSSDRDIAAIVSIKNANVPGASDGYTQGAYNGTSTGATTLYFPSLFSFQYMVSRISVQNTEESEAEVFLNYYDREGNFVGRNSAILQPYSQRTFDLGVDGDVPFTPDDSGTEFKDGAAVVTSTNQLAGAAVTIWGDRFASYQALTASNQGLTLYAPSQYRYQYDTSSYSSSNPAEPADAWTLFSAINLQNTSEAATANVTATYVSRSDGSTSLVKEFTIPPQSAAGLNTKNGGDFPASDFFDLSNADQTNGVPDWDGSVTITSDQPLVGIVNTNWGSKPAAGAYALVTENDGAAEVFVPAQYRLDWGGGWAQWSALNLMNVGGSSISASDLSIQYIDTNGNEIETFTGGDLPGDLGEAAALGLNTRNGGDLDASAFAGFPTDDGLPRFIGGIYVSAPAGSKLVGVANIIYNNRASVYNAFPGE